MDILLSPNYLMLFLIISIGLIIGRLKIRGFSLDMSAVIFVALLFGHLGFSLPGEFQQIGLVFFIFTIGLQAGPGFFGAFKRNGRNLVVLAVSIVFSAALAALAIGKMMGLDNVMTMGLFNGALTSTPGLASAIEISGSPTASIGYGIAYPFGIIMVILFFQTIPSLLKLNLRKAERDYEEEMRETNPPLIHGNFVVENPKINGKSLTEMAIRSVTGCVVSRVKHGDITTTPAKGTRLFPGDIVRLVGTAEDLQRGELLIGSPVDEELPLMSDYEVQWLLVTNKQIVNKTLPSLDLFSNFNATIVRIRRSGIDIKPDKNSMLRFGDRLLVASDRESFSQLTRIVGNDNKRLSETDFLPITLGILIGVLLGKIEIPFFGLFSFNLGVTGGVLTAAIFLSGIGKTGPILWSMSSYANVLLRELGLLMFMAVVGTEAGAQLSEVLQEGGGWSLMGAGALITVTPLLVGFLTGKYLLKMNDLTLLGVMAGATTSTPGLAAINSRSETSIAQIAYAAVYPIALVMMILISNLLYLI